jgi:hypothetical protein
MDDLSAYCGFKVLPQDEIVENPTIDTKYHLVWAHKRGMVWVLVAIQGGTAVMQTPKTKRILSAKVSDLRHLNKHIIAKARRRHAYSLIKHTKACLDSIKKRKGYLNTTK